ncbi:MAG: DUF523 and DUF1722 domain-containing protein [Pseudomonadales bacterium]|nr:DUF523 and DUF1722 domain-containing protein [Pseudomonadales bacterium]
MHKIKVGISSCLLGQAVRYNGGHKHSETCSGDLGRYFDYVPVCPEVGIGLGVPRKPIRLVGDPADPRAVGVENPDFDVTARLQDFGRKKAPELADLSGYIFIKGSPSCGLFRVKVYRRNGYPEATAGTGIYAKVITDSYPLLPVEEDGRLQDPVLKENFVTRVFAYAHWQALKQQGLSARRLIEFHSRYKYTLLAHDRQAYSELGRLLADAGREDPEALGQSYFARLMQALTKKATRRTHTSVAKPISNPTRMI